MESSNQLSNLDPRYPKVKNGIIKFAIIANGSTRAGDLQALRKELDTCSGILLADGGGNFFLSHLQNSKESHSYQVFALAGDLDSITSENCATLIKMYPKMDLFRFEKEKDFTDLEACLKLVRYEYVDEVVILNSLGGRIDQTLGNLLYLYRQPYVDKVSIITSTGSKLFVIGSDKSRPLKNVKGKWLSFIPLYGAAEAIHLGQNTIAPQQTTTTVSIEEHDTYVHTAESQQLCLLHDHHVLEDELQLISDCLQGSFEKLNEKVFIVPPTRTSYTYDVKKGQTISLVPVGGPVKGITTSGLQWELREDTLDYSFIGISNVALSDRFAISVRSGSLLCILN